MFLDIFEISTEGPGGCPPGASAWRVGAGGLGEVSPKKAGVRGLRPLANPNPKNFNLRP